MQSPNNTEGVRSKPAPERLLSPRTRGSCDCVIPMEYINRGIQKMAEAGLRVTQPRRQVISCLATAQSPLTIPELCSTLGAQLKRGTRPLSKVSVYRIVSELERIHLVHRVLPSGGYLPCSHLDCADHPHVIVACDKCGRIDEMSVPTDYVAPFFLFLKNRGMVLSRCPTVRIDGLCDRCAQD